MAYTVNAGSIADDLFTNTFAYYKMEESGVPIVDSSNNHNLSTGSVSFQNLTTGIIGNAPFFNSGSAHRAYKSVANTTMPRYPFISFWGREDQNVASGYTVNLHHATAVPAGNTGYDGVVNINGAFITSALNNAPPSNLRDRITTSNDVMSKGWTHFVYFYNGTDNNVCINGTKTGTHTFDEHDSDITYSPTTYISMGVRINTNAPQAGTYFDGQIDEVYIGNIGDIANCSTGFNTHAGFLYAGGNPTAGQQYPFLNDTLPPGLNVAYPEINKHLNASGWNGTIIVDANETITNCSINNGNFDNLGNNGTRNIFNNSLLLNQNYSITVWCQDIFGNIGSTSHWNVYDTIFPIISDFDSPTNGSFIDKNGNVNFILNIEYFDTYLLLANTTIRDGLGNFYYKDFFNDTVGNVTTYEIMDTISLGNFSVGIYTLRSELTDTHTRKEFKEKVNVTKKKIGAKWEEATYKLSKTDIKFTYNSDLTLDTIKTTDRFKQKFSSNKKGKKSIIIEGSDNIRYLHGSPYPCHFIIDNEYWYDCQGLDNPVVKITNDKKTMMIDFDLNTDSVTTESLGGLNEIIYLNFFEVIDTSGNQTASVTVNFDTEGLNNSLLLFFGFVIWAFFIYISVRIDNPFISIAMGIYSIFFGIWIINNIGLPSIIPIIFMLMSVYIAYQLSASANSYSD